MKLLFDDKEFIISPFAHSIAALAKENGISIPTPCMDNGHFCCHACLVRVNGDEKYACKTKPTDGMVIEFDKEDLKAKRIENMKKYKEKLNAGTIRDCGCVANS